MSLPRWLPIALLGAILAVTGASLLFTTYMMYDDEGYVLFSLQEFVTGGGLYERVYSQYGPFFFLFSQALHFFGAEFTNTGGRLLALAFWLGASGFCSAIVWRITRSTAATVFTLGGVFLHLWSMVNEPSHPGGFITFTVAAMAWCGVKWIEQPRKLAVAAGIIGAALVFTKINVGVFLIAGAGAWWALQVDTSIPSFRVRAWLVGIVMILLPVALMRGQMDHQWVVIFASIAAMSGAATVMVAASATRGMPSTTRWSDLWLALGVGGLVALVTCVAIIVQGTSLRGLLDGVLLGPLRHPQVYTAPVNWRAGALPVACGSLAFAVWSITRPSVFVQRAVIAGRIVAVVVFYTSISLALSLNSHAFALSFALSAIWWFVLPIGGDRATQPARTWLALLLVPQALHAFPVAGSQISWGTFLWVPLAAIGVSDAAKLLAPEGAVTRRRFVTVVAAIMMLTTTTSGIRYGWVGITRLRTNDSLGLPGAGALRLPEYFTTALRLLAENTIIHADVVFSLPGMHSFHLWTDVPPPTPTNATHWFTLLSLAQQEEIRARLAAAPRSCIIVQRSVYDFLVHTGIATETPLTVWLKANYESAFEIESYEFWVRKGRKIAPINTVTAREAAPGISPRYQFSLTLAKPTLRDVATIEFARFDGDVSSSVMTWTEADSQLFITPINSAGAPQGATRQVTFPFSSGGLIRLDLRTDKLPASLPREGIFYLRDAAGQRVAEARLIGR